MPSGWSVDYGGDSQYAEGTGQMVYTSPASVESSPFLAKEVQLDRRDIANGWSPVTRKFVAWQVPSSAGYLESNGTLAFGGESLVVLSVEKRNDGAQWFIYAQRTD